MKKEGKKVFYLTRADYEKLELQIAAIREEIKRNSAGYKDVDTDIFQKEIRSEANEILRKELFLKGQIKLLEDQIKNAVIVESYENSDAIKVGDMLLVEMFSNPEDVNDYKIKLVATLEATPEDVIPVSVHSPLGEAVLGKMAGDIASYVVDKTTTTVTIKDKLVLDQEGKVVSANSISR